MRFWSLHTFLWFQSEISCRGLLHNLKHISSFQLVAVFLQWCETVCTGRVMAQLWNVKSKFYSIQNQYRLFFFFLFWKFCFKKVVCAPSSFCLSRFRGFCFPLSIFILHPEYQQPYHCRTDKKVIELWYFVCDNNFSHPSANHCWQWLRLALSVSFGRLELRMGDIFG